MDTLLVIPATAVWLGILTSVSPCPLATNVAATSFLARRADGRRRALAGVAAYTLGRMTAYVALAGLVLAGVSSMPALASFLRLWVVPLVGPLLVLTGMAVLGWLPLPGGRGGAGAQVAQKFAGWGLAGEFALGGLFALSFCPLSAALFFGSLLPLAMLHALPALPVALYGAGTAAPVALIAVLLVVSAERASRLIGRLQNFQQLALRLTGVILLAIGLWLVATATLNFGG